MLGQRVQVKECIPPSEAELAKLPGLPGEGPHDCYVCDLAGQSGIVVASWKDILIVEIDGVETPFLRGEVE